MVEATALGGTTDANAFSLAARAAAGAYEYRLYRGGLAGGNADDWFLRSHLVEVAAPDAPLYRPEVPLYLPIPEMARHMGLAYLGTLHEREGDHGNLMPSPATEGLPQVAWAKVIGESGHGSWGGPFNVSADGAQLAGLQAGLDIFRHEDGAGNRNHMGAYAGFVHHSARISGDALNQSNLRVGNVSLSGPVLGAYWTHYGANGAYLDGVVQLHGFSAAGLSDFGAQLNTTGQGFTGSLEAGQAFVLDNNWQIEPQAQLIYQSLSVAAGADKFSPVSFAAGDALTGRLGLRVQYRHEEGDTLFEPYVEANPWHGVGGTDATTFGASRFENHFGGTALDLGAGFSAKMSENTSLHGYVDHRWSIGGAESGSITQAGLGLRVKW